MKKLLFLPFLNIPSGHHQAADAIKANLQNSNVICEKVDIFSYSYGKLENFTSKFYLKWIHYSPQTYNELYKYMVLTNLHKDKDKYIYEWFFESQIKKLVGKIKPDAIICTHALPSRLLSRMKSNGQLDIPVFNVYTDYFIHKGWGITNMDGHFISTANMQNYLLTKGINMDDIYFTGIPIHPELRKKLIVPERPKLRANVLITGGSMGAGNLTKLVDNLIYDPRVHYFVLCGKNYSLYNKLKKRKLQNLTPLPYIQSRRMMDMVYNHVDLVVTKPGGVTTSECIQKKLPIFIYDRLPGQEEKNFHELQALGIIQDCKNWRNYGGLNEDIINFLYNPTIFSQYFGHVHQYNKNFINESPATIILNKIS